MKNTDEETAYGRRQFLASAAGLAGASMAMSFPRIGLSQSLWQPFTVGQVIDIILKEVPGAPFATTVDQLRSRKYGPGGNGHRYNYVSDP
jgi:hypothetical protein